MTKNNKEKITIPGSKKLNKSDPFYKDIVKAHKKAFVNDEMTYTDPKTGLIVFTAAYHLKRGYCCGSGCRHCPFSE